MKPLKYPEVNENETYLSKLWDTEKKLLSRKFITLNTYITKDESLKINELAFHFKKLKNKDN